MYVNPAHLAGFIIFTKTRDNEFKRSTIRSLQSFARYNG